MSNKKGIPGNQLSDESNSTEHDLSVSGTDDNADTHSILSDSTLNKLSKGSDSKRMMAKLHKLKEDNMLLRDALDKANATDITTLRTKLRGSNADLVRVRQHNSELKDRVQILEARLIDSLGNRTIAANTITIRSLPPQVDSIDKTAENEQSLQALRSKCKHLTRLVHSYETKMSIMQSELDNAKKSSGEIATNSTDIVLQHSDQQSLTQSTKKAVRIQETVESEVRRAREEDSKTIRELSAEVKRLVTLLSRGDIARQEGGIEEGNERHNENIHEDGEEESEVESKQERFKVREQKYTSLAIAQETVTKDNEAGKLICSFIMGLVVMLLCVGLSASFGV